MSTSNVIPNGEQELAFAMGAVDTPERVAHNARLRKTGQKLVLAVGGAALGFTVLSIPFCLPAVRRVCVPYVPATQLQINSILNCLKKHTPPRAKVIDLGSGDGRVCIACAKEGYPSTGVELNSVLWLWSSLMKYTRGVSNLCSFKKRNLFKEDLSKYDAVTIFGAPTLMQALEPKVAKECKESAKLIVCRYPFLKWAPNHTYGNGIDCVWVYEKPFLPNHALPAIYLELVEFSDHPLHPSNQSQQTQTDTVQSFQSYGEDDLNLEAHEEGSNTEAHKDGLNTEALLKELEPKSKTESRTR